MEEVQIKWRNLLTQEMECRRAEIAERLDGFRMYISKGVSSPLNKKSNSRLFFSFSKKKYE